MSKTRALVIIGTLTGICLILWILTLSRTDSPGLDPIAQKAYEFDKMEKMHESVMQLATRMAETAQTGNQNVFTVPFDANWSLDRSTNSIILSLTSRITDVTPNIGWIDIPFGRNNSLRVWERADRVGMSFDTIYKLQVQTIGLDLNLSRVRPGTMVLFTKTENVLKVTAKA